MYHSELLAKRQELISLLGAVRDGIKVEQVADAIDEAVQVEHRDFTSKILNQERELLKRVDLALSRLALGSFGACEGCDTPIPEKRLRAVPWAELCRECQEQQETDYIPSSKPKRPTLARNRDTPSIQYGHYALRELKMTKGITPFNAQPKEIPEERLKH